MVKTRRRRQLTINVAPRFTALAGVREELRRWLTSYDVEETVVDDLVLVATELCTNAMEATVPDERVWVEVTNDGTAVRLSVANATRPAAPEAEPAAELEAGSLQERGRGLAIVRALVDTVAMTSVGERTVVRTMRLL